MDKALNYKITGLDINYKKTSLDINDLLIEIHYRALEKVEDIIKGLTSRIEEIDISTDRPSENIIIDVQGYMIELEVIKEMLCDSDFPYCHSESWQGEAIDIYDEICNLYGIEKFIG